MDRESTAEVVWPRICYIDTCNTYEDIAHITPASYADAWLRIHVYWSFDLHYCLSGASFRLQRAGDYVSDNSELQKLETSLSDLLVWRVTE